MAEYVIALVSDTDITKNKIYKVDFFDAVGDACIYDDEGKENVLIARANEFSVVDEATARAEAPYLFEKKSAEFNIGDKYKIKKWFDLDDHIGTNIEVIAYYSHRISFKPITKSSSKSFYCRRESIGADVILDPIQESHQFVVGQKVVAIKDGKSHYGVRFKKGMEFFIKIHEPDEDGEIVVKGNPKVNNGDGICVCPEYFKPAPTNLTDQECEKLVEGLTKEWSKDKPISPVDFGAIPDEENEDLNYNVGLIGPTEKAEQEIERWRKGRFKPVGTEWHGFNHDRER